MKSNLAPQIPSRFLTTEDAELLSREFNIDSPENLPNLITTPHKSDEIPKIEFKYDATPSGGMKAGHKTHIECAFPHSARHWKGFVLLYKNGERILIGQCCGAKHFGIKFGNVEKAFNQQSKRKILVDRLLKLLELLPSTLNELSELKKHSSIIAHDIFRREITKNFYDLEQQITKIAIKDSGALRAFERFRDREKEEEIAEEQAPELLTNIVKAQEKGERARIRARKQLKRWRNQNKYYKTRDKSFGNCAGYKLFVGPRLLTNEIEKILQSMKNIHKNLLSSSSDQWTNSKIQILSNNLKYILEDANTAMNQLVELSRFADIDNFQKIAKWSEYENKSIPSTLPYYLTTR